MSLVGQLSVSTNDHAVLFASDWMLPYMDQVTYLVDDLSDFGVCLWGNWLCKIDPRKLSGESGVKWRYCEVHHRKYL